MLHGVGHGLLGDLHRVDLAHLEHGDIELAAHDLKLPDGGGAVDVAGHKKRPLALGLFEPAGELCAVGGFARALQTHQHDHRRPLGGEGDLLVFAAHEAGELFVYDLHHHLGGGQTFEHVVAHAALGDGLDKVLDHLVAHVGLKQGQADLPHGFFHVAFGQPPLAAQPLEGGG